MTDRRSLGARGESFAALAYERAGFEIVDRNWRTVTGEIDLVVRRGDLTVFCEVKTRRSTRFGAPIEAVTEEKARRVRRLAAEWLGTTRARGSIRFDVAAVVVDPRGECAVEILEDVF